MIEALYPAARILAMAAFILLAKSGWITWLTPENAHDVANQTLDFLVVAAPAAYAAWASFKEWRAQRAAERAAQPAAMINAVSELPGVEFVKVDDPVLAADLGPKVVS